MIPNQAAVSRILQLVALTLAFSVLATAGYAVSGAATNSQESRAGHELQYRGEPVDLGASAPGLGQRIADLHFDPVDGGPSTLADAAGPAGLVIAMRDPGCPVSKKYGPRLAAIEREFAAQGFGFLFVNPLPYATATEAAQEIEWYGFKGSYSVQPHGGLANQLAAVTSTEVFVLDAARTLVYRGAIDDQHGIGYTRAEPRRNYLRDALVATAAAALPDVRATMSPGCYLASAQNAGQVATAAVPVTWHNRVSRIVQARCQRCHHQGGVGPFPLVEYRDFMRRKGMIEWTLTDGIMPPWFAEGPHEWANDSSLTADEMDTVTAWLAAGAPEGDPADAPVPMRWLDGWTLGEPDVALAIPEPFTVPAEGVVEYQYQYIKTDFPEDRWVSAIDVVAGAREVVHHVLVFIEDPEIRDRALAGDRTARRQQQGGARTYFASNVPGQSGLRFPEGYGKLLPAGAWLKVQLHYTANGREMTDQTRIGLHFADTPVHTEVRTNSAVNFRFAIPPRAAEHQVTAEYRFDEEADLLSFLPHTHVRGIAFRYELVDPDGRSELLLDVPRYDFNWQLNYVLRDPLAVSAGTTLRATAWYDNSADNPANPDPTQEVGWGEQTFEEMMIGYVNWVPRNPAGVSEN